MSGIHYCQKLKKHNKDLNYLHSEFDNFSFDNIIKNPASITADIIEIYNKNISILNQYKHKLKRLVFYFVLHPSHWTKEQ